MNKKTGILLVNLGSPIALKTSHIRAFLKEFLSDPLVVDYPRWFWMPVLHGLILRARPKKLLHKYQQIWNQGSPLHQVTFEQKHRLDDLLDEHHVVEVAMRYGCPCIAGALRRLVLQGIDNVLVIPMFPQYSITTIKSIEMHINHLLKDDFENLRVNFLAPYFKHPAYIHALAQSIKKSGFSGQADQKLLFSFHSVPKRYLKKDPLYHAHCVATVEHLVAHMGLQKNQYLLGFQSRFGVEPWLSPQSDALALEVAKTNQHHLYVIAPGFAADCLETLEEINMEMRALFEANSKHQFHYIPALNAHIDFLKPMIESKQHENRS